MPGNAAHDYEVREAINQVVDASRKLLDTDERPVQRDQHPKQHGCVRARFVVGKNLGDAYRQGLFQQEKVYDAWIRFSNGGQRDDRKPDAHGMAVKLMGVEGPKVLATERDATTHDFVMVDNPTFFLRGAVEYGRFSDVLLKARGKEPSSLYNVLGFFLSGPMRLAGNPALLSALSGAAPHLSSVDQVRQQADRQPAHNPVLEHHAVQVRRYVHEVFGRAGRIPRGAAGRGAQR